MIPSKVKLSNDYSLFLAIVDFRGACDLKASLDLEADRT